MAVNGLASCTARPSAIRILTMQDKQVLVFLGEGFQPAAQSQRCRNHKESKLLYLIINSAQQGLTHRGRDKMAAIFQTTFLKAFSWITRQIWGIWKLRPAYSPEMPNLGQNRWCFVPCDLEIWWMTLENSRASLLCCFKLCATFHSHRWIQTGVAVRKRPIWVKFDDF